MNRLLDGHQAPDEGHNQTRADINDILWDEENNGVALPSDGNSQFRILSAGLVIPCVADVDNHRRVDNTRSQRLQQIEEKRWQLRVTGL